MNEIDNNIVLDTENENQGVSVQAYYDYYEVVTRLDTINTKLDNQYKLLNDSFCYLNFIITMFVLYYFIRKLMGRS